MASAWQLWFVRSNGHVQTAAFQSVGPGFARASLHRRASHQDSQAKEATTADRVNPFKAFKLPSNPGAAPSAGAVLNAQPSNAISAFP